MKQTKIDIYNALKQIPGISVHTGWIPTGATYPCLSFYQVSGSRGTADGKLSNINIDELYSIDIFAKSMLATEDIAELVDSAMDTLNYVIIREGSVDLFEPDTKIFHKILRYRFK